MNNEITLQEFLRYTAKLDLPSVEGKEDYIRPRCAMRDGFTISIQAGSHYYSTPRKDGKDHYTDVEMAFPSKFDPIIEDWADDPEDFTGCIYPFVPEYVVNELIEAHGGIYGWIEPFAGTVQPMFKDDVTEEQTPE